MGQSPRVLLVTNDFPPTLGGIQTYLYEFIQTLEPDRLVVFASTQDEQAAQKFDHEVPFTMIRWPHQVMLPTPRTARRMQDIIRAWSIDTVWFGSSTPLGVMASAARRAGARKIVASTHGHEIGWSMIPVARQVLRLIGSRVDTLTYVSQYARRRTQRAFGPNPQWVSLQPGIDLSRFSPHSAARDRIRREYGLDRVPVVACISRIVPRKGQDMLVEALPRIRQRIPQVKLLIVGPGTGRESLMARASALGVGDALVTTGPVPFDALPDYYRCADVFAMPVRTVGGGLDVEGLGIVFLEAQACGIPVVAGNGGGAPETVLDSETGLVVNGRKLDEIADAVTRLLADPTWAATMGDKGRRHIESEWSWSVRGPQLAHALFDGLD
ncbi:glycosyltransferase family 4 protein [Corynebacterium kroppenstedtii]|uniref:glycosyltransferase family 4 protein n=1 Tax=Corynebacterium sp. PCR 32 TaxID=3351342 RepID=UPI00309BB700